MVRMVVGLVVGRQAGAGWPAAFFVATGRRNISTAKHKTSWTWQRPSPHWMSMDRLAATFLNGRLFLLLSALDALSAARDITSAKAPGHHADSIPQLP